MRVDSSAIRGIGRSLESGSELGFAEIENQGLCEDEKLSLFPGRR